MNKLYRTGTLLLSACLSASNSLAADMNTLIIASLEKREHPDTQLIHTAQQRKRELLQIIQNSLPAEVTRIDTDDMGNPQIKPSFVPPNWSIKYRNSKLTLEYNITF